MEKVIPKVDINFTDLEREEYGDQLKQLRIQNNMVKNQDKGRQEGIEKTAINMLRQKLNDNLICQVTGLSNDELLKLKNKL